MAKLDNDFIKTTLTSNKNKEASLALGTSQHMISYYRKKFGIRSPHSQSLAARKFTVNSDFFENIDSETKAYCLGFVAADGSVSGCKYSSYLSIALHPKDVDILHKINIALDSTYSVKTITLPEASGFPGSSKTQCLLQVCDKKLVLDLSKYYVVPNKTATVRMPIIPNHLYKHYLRGMLDGDGYINKEAFGWTGNPTMINDIQGFCLQNGFEPLKRYSNKSGTTNTVKGGPVNFKFIQWLYEDSTIYMDRKHEAFNTFWKNRVYKKRSRSYPELIKHIPCALEALPSNFKLDSMP